MKNILKTILILLVFCLTFKVSAQTIVSILDEKNLLDERIEKILNKNNFKYSRIAEDFKNINLSGLYTENADFSNINEAIDQLKLEGWDVKIISRYNLEKYFGSNATEDYLTNVLTEKQIIVDVYSSSESGSTFTANVRSPEYSGAVLGSLEKIIESHLNTAVKSYDVNKLFTELSKALSFLLKSNIDNLTLSDDSNNRSPDVSGLPKILVTEGGYYLSNAGIPIFIPKGAIISFWSNTSYHPSDKENTLKFSKGMIAYIEINGKAFPSRGKMIDGKMITFYQSSDGDIYKQPHDFTKKMGEPVTVNVGVGGQNCSSLSLYQIKINVTHIPMSGANILLGNEYVDVEKDIEFLNYKQNLLGTDGTIRFSDIAITSPRNLNADCPPVLSSADVLNALNQSDFYCKIENDPNDVSNPNKYIITFNNGDSYLLFYSTTKTWFTLGKNTNSWLRLTVTDNSHEITIDNFVKKRVKDLQIYNTAKTVFFFVVGVAAGVATGGLSTMAVLAVDVGLAAVEAGVIYYVEKDATSAIITLVTGGLGSGIGVMAGKALSKGADDVIKNAAKEGIPAETALTVKAARSATKTSSEAIDGVIKIDGGFVKMSAIRDYAKNILKYTDDELQYLGDDLLVLASKGKQSWLCKCPGISSIGSDRIDNSRNGTPCLLKARSILAEAAILASGKTSNKKIWITSSDEIYERLIAEGKDQDEVFLNKLKDYYSKHSMAKECNGSPPCSVQRTIDGKTFNVDFDKYGNVDFREGLAPIENKRFVSQTLDGSNDDLAKAAEWFVENNPNATLGPNGTTIIVDNLEYAMHHMPDGYSIDPILQRLHTALKNNKGESVSHTGAASFLKIKEMRALKGFFLNPY